VHKTTEERSLVADSGAQDHGSEEPVADSGAQDYRSEEVVADSGAQD